MRWAPVTFPAKSRLTRTRDIPISRYTAVRTDWAVLTVRAVRHRRRLGRSVTAVALAPTDLADETARAVMVGTGLVTTVLGAQRQRGQCGEERTALHTACFARSAKRCTLLTSGSVTAAGTSKGGAFVRRRRPASLCRRA